MKKAARKPSVGPSKRVVMNPFKQPEESTKRTDPPTQQVEMVSPEILKTTMESFTVALTDLAKYYETQTTMLAERIEKIGKDVL